MSFLSSDSVEATQRDFEVRKSRDFGVQVDRHHSSTWLDLKLSNANLKKEATQAFSQLHSTKQDLRSTRAKFSVSAAEDRISAMQLEISGLKLDVDRLSKTLTLTSQSDLSRAESMVAEQTILIQELRDKNKRTLDRSRSSRYRFRERSCILQKAMAGRELHWQELVDDLKSELDSAKEVDEVLSEIAEVEIMVDGRYSDTVRAVIYQLLGDGAPCKKVGKWLQLILEKLAGRKVPRLPSYTTVRRMVSEMDVAGDHQNIVEGFLVSKKGNGGSHDGTTAQQLDIMGFAMEVKNSGRALTLGVRPLEDHAAHTVLGMLHNLMAELREVAEAVGLSVEDVAAISELAFGAIMHVRPCHRCY